ncbi:MAG: MATE family efflux transporter [Coprococcus sp.]
MDGALSYLTVILAGIPLTMAYNLESSLLRSIGNSVTPLIFLVFSSVLNVILDYLFMGPSPWATVVACHRHLPGISAILGLFCILFEDILSSDLENMI